MAPTEQKENRPQSILNLIQTSSGIGIWIRTIKSIAAILFSVLFLIVAINLGLPWYFALVLGLFILVIIALTILDVYRVKRLSSDLKTMPSESPSASRNSILITPEEKVIIQIPGIMRVMGKGLEIRSITPIFSGVAEIRNPENAMIVTDKHILFLYISLPSSDKNILGADMGIANWALSHKEISEKMRTLLMEHTLESVFKSYPKNFGLPLADIARVVPNDQTHVLSIETNDGTIHAYAIRDPEDYKLATHIFSNYIG